MIIDTAQPYAGGIPSEDRLHALHCALADCGSIGDLNAFLASTWGRSALRGDNKQAAAWAIHVRYRELCAQAPGDPARSGTLDQGT